MAWLMNWYTWPQVWDARRKGCLFTYKGHTEAVKDIKFSPDGQWVVSASSDATVKVRHGGRCGQCVCVCGVGRRGGGSGCVVGRVGPYHLML